MAEKVRKVEPYGLDPGFARGLVTLVCRSPRVFARVGVHMDPYALDGPVRLALQAAQAVAFDLGGRGPDSLTTVLQRLRRWVYDGKATIEEVESVANLFDAAEDAGLPPEDETVAEITPILRQRVQHEAVIQATHEYSNQGDFGQVVRLISRANGIGTVETSPGIRLGTPAASQEVQNIGRLTRLLTGIPELDRALDLGPPRGTLSMFVGGAGDGKSMALTQVAAETAFHGMHVAVATLELSVGVWGARAMANLTGIPVNAILYPTPGKPGLMEAETQMASLTLGNMVLKHFTANATTVDDLHSWVREEEVLQGFPFDVVAVDYLDLVCDPNVKDNGYLEARNVYKGFRAWMEGEGKWGWTASQAKVNKDKRKDANSPADSSHKQRLADLLITLNVSGDEGSTQVEFYIGKNRYGNSRRTAGPYPTEFPFGQIVAVSRA